LEAAAWSIFIVLKQVKNSKNLGQFAAFKLKTIPSGNENHGNEFF
jgi:hypothetical protein